MGDLAHNITLESVIQGREEAFLTALKKLRTDSGHIVERLSKNSLTNKDYQLLVQFQDSLISAYDSAGTLTTLYLVRDFSPVVE